MERMALSITCRIRIERFMRFGRSVVKLTPPPLHQQKTVRQYEPTPRKLVCTWSSRNTETGESEGKKRGRKKNLAINICWWRVQLPIWHVNRKALRLEFWHRGAPGDAWLTERQKPFQTRSWLLLIMAARSLPSWRSSLLTSPLYSTRHSGGGGERGIRYDSHVTLCRRTKLEGQRKETMRIARHTSISTKAN